MRNADVMASATLVAVRRPRDDPRLSGYCPANISLLFSKYPWNDVLIRGENSSEIAVASIIRDKKTTFLCRKVVRKNLQNRRRGGKAAVVVVDVTSVFCKYTDINHFIDNIKLDSTYLPFE